MQRLLEMPVARIGHRERALEAGGELVTSSWNSFRRATVFSEADDHQAVALLGFLGDGRFGFGRFFRLWW